MKFKNNSNNKKTIDWKAYKEELGNRATQGVFNEYERDLHTMTMKEGPYEKCISSPKYKIALNDMPDFDRTNLDYFNYEKELTLGKFNN
jgi:hypothetical protein